MNLSSLIERLEKAEGPDRELDLSIELFIHPQGKIADLMQYRRGFDGKDGMAWDIHHGGAVCFEKHIDGRCTFNGGYPLSKFTASIDDLRKEFEYLCVFASDIGADGLSLVKLVADTSTSPIVEYDGIHSRLEIAWLIAALRARSAMTERLK